MSIFLFPLMPVIDKLMKINGQQLLKSSLAYTHSAHVHAICVRCRRVQMEYKCGTI